MKSLCMLTFDNARTALKQQLWDTFSNKCKKSHPIIYHLLSTYILPILILKIHEAFHLYDMLYHYLG